MDDPDLVVIFFRGARDLEAGVGGVVASDQEDVADIIFAEARDDLVVVTGFEFAGLPDTHCSPEFI